MNFVILTIFPELIHSFFQNGMIRKALEEELISCESLNIRDYADNKHRVTDDRPYGGGSGMVMKPEPLSAALSFVKKKYNGIRTIYVTPQGRTFTQKIARDLSQYENLAFVCGRYEGVDDRVCRDMIDDEISIGDYVMTGGELASMVIVDAVARLVPGVLGGVDSAEKETFENDLVEHAHFTRPPVFKGEKVPDVLLSGNHMAIDEYRLEDSLKRTFLKRPDLFCKRDFSESEKAIIRKWCAELEQNIKT